MRISLLTLLLISFLHIANGQASFQRAYSFGDSTGLFGFDFGHIEPGADNTFFIMETRRQINVKDEFVIIKSDTTLNPIFAVRIRRLNTAGSQGDHGGDVLPLPDGGFLMTNHVEGPTGTSPDDFALFRFDSLGQLIYHKQFDNPSSLFPFNLKYFAQDSILLGFRAGGRFGYMMAGYSGNQHHIRAGDFTGIVSYGNSGILKTPDHHIVNFAEAYWDTSPADKPQLAVTRYDQNGNLQWAYRYEDTLYHYFIHDGTALPNGNLLFCGTRRPNGNSGGYGLLICISPTGQLLWTKVYNPLPITFSKLNVISADTILVSCTRNNPYFGVNLLVDTTGAILFGSGYHSGIQFYDNYHLTICNDDRHLISATGLNTAGGPGIILAKSYAPTIPHCTHNPVLPSATPVTGFTTYSDFVPSSLAFTEITPTRTYIFDNTLPAVALQCIATNTHDEVMASTNDVSISPNPSPGTFAMTLADDWHNTRYEIRTPQGKLIDKGWYNDRETTVHLGNQPSGIYILITYLENKVIYHKLVVSD